MTTKLEFLAQHPIFVDLDDDELLALSHIAREYEFEAGAVIAYQRDAADEMVIVKSGRLHAKEVDNYGRVRQANTRNFTENDFFGAEWLFEPGTHPATVTGTHDGRLITIRGDDFRRFLINYPEAIHHLEPLVDEEGYRYGGLPEEAWDRANRLPLRERRDHIGPIRLMPDELVEYYSRRSTIVLMMSLLWPALALFLIPMLTYFLMPNDTALLQTSRLFIMGGSIVFFGIIILFRIQDWRNDYFVITNKHISHREFELPSFRTQVHKVPISQVQSVTVERPTLTANLFNVGTVRITTASVVGNIIFDGIDNPREVEDILEDLRQRVVTTNAAAAQSYMRNTVERHFQLDPTVRAVGDSETEEAEQVLMVTDRRRSVFSRYIDWRVEEDGVITYRRNYFILFWEMLLPFLVIGLLLITGGIVRRYLFLDWITILAALTPLVLVTVVWLIWRFEDWRNDMFQLTERDVIDIDRKPFGFGESRKQAPLSNIQNVTAERPGFFATLFDYGNVRIETAGAQAEIVFDKIPQPSRVLADIFRRLDETRERDRRRDGENRREEYAVLLDVFRQEDEQGRIPRRTPRRTPD